MKRAFALALLIVSLAPMPVLAATLPNPNWPAPADRSENLLRQIVLNTHNQARSRFGVPPLAWSDQLATEARSYAQSMAQTGIYGHDQSPERRKKAGENLWRGQRGLFSYDVMIGVMIAEGQNFRAGVFPNNSRTGEWHDVGHYTQIIWPTTTSVGCGLASSATTDYFVCRYSPTGNKDGFELAQGRD